MPRPWGRRQHLLGTILQTPAGSADPIRILVADDHPILREGVAAIIALQKDMDLAGEAATGVQAVELYETLRPEVVLMDLRMPEMTGVEAIEKIRAMHPEARIIVLTTYSGDAKALEAMRAGAAGFLLKSSLRRELLDAIRAVHRGQRHLHPDVAQDIALHAIEESLTTREIEVLQMIAGGHSNKQVAWKLGVAEETIKSNIKSIFAKLRVNDRTHAVTTAAKRGLIEL
ncbi:response regulator transcription factor [Novosphingobium sp. 1Y9A]|uniref:Response regulator transcription factor n=1 Tax=Novosphingobium jiangmenense TaxID=2791981 RepID=A0ABS0HIN2_9SPHN|nr:response regulator transcription factor [Novosphingobium jiangmenense]